ANSVAVVQPRDVGHMVPNAACDERHARSDSLTRLERGLEGIAERRQVGHSRLHRMYAVRPELFAAQSQQFEWGNTVACKVAVQRRRSAVARLSRIAQENLSSAPSQHQGGAQPGGTTAD